MLKALWLWLWLWLWQKNKIQIRSFNPVRQIWVPGTVQCGNSYAQSGWALLQKMFRKSFWLYKIRIYKKDYIYICIPLKKSKTKISLKQICKLVGLEFMKTCDELFPRCKFPLPRLRPFSYIRSGSISQRCLHRLPSIKKFENY